RRFWRGCRRRGEGLVVVALPGQKNPRDLSIPGAVLPCCLPLPHEPFGTGLGETIEIVPSDPTETVGLCDAFTTPAFCFGPSVLSRVRVAFAFAVLITNWPPVRGVFAFT